MVKRILVLERLEINRIVLTDILEEIYDIVFVTSTEQLMDILDKEYKTFSAIILDLGLKDDDYEPLKMVKANSNYAGIPVIVNAGMGGEDAMRKAQSLGADEYFAKPYNSFLINRRIHNVIFKEEVITEVVLHESVSMVKQILILERLEANRTVLRHMLKEDYDVFLAATEDEAIEIINKNHETLSAIIVDLGLKDDDYEALENIEANPLVVDVPVIANIGLGGDFAREQVLALGADNYFGKPYNTFIIKRRIHNLIYAYADAFEDNQKVSMIKRIMILERLQANQDTLEDMLVANYDVDFATTEEEAMAIISNEENVFSAIILDLGLKDDDYSALRKVVEMPLYKDTPIIVNTGLGGEKAWSKALKLGANACISKPYNSFVINRCIHDAIYVVESATEKKII